MKVLVIGVKGMLGTDVMEACLEAGMDALGFDLPELDITKYTEMLPQLPNADLIINCAAYTRVDDAQTERDAAFGVNSEGVRNLARLSHQRQVRVMHVSTDYVFDGMSKRPYLETDRTNPLNMYGASKLAGEKALRSGGGPYVIVRTQSLFGKHGPNFVKAIVRKLKEGDEPLRVVNDQVSAPTYTRHLADAMVRLATCRADGIVHVSAAGSCSWYDFACAIVERLKPGHEVIPVSSAEMKRPAARPKYSLLDQQRYTALTGHSLPDWQEGLDAYLEEENRFA
jgi:dTDP-4-dehydrorhamnose reductase